MKNALPTLITFAMILFIAGCEQFTTSYQRVDESEFRLLDFMYFPPDAAPGDSVTLWAVFAGKEVELDGYLEWWISFNMIRDLYGSSTVVDSVRLEPIARRLDGEFSPKTQTVAFRFKIPDDIVRKSASIPEVWTDMLPSNIVKALPPQLTSMTKNEIIDSIESGNSAIINPFTLQLFTVPIRIFVKMNEPGRLPHTIRSNHSIRYNSRFPGIVPINHNPQINELVILKIEGEDATNSFNWDKLRGWFILDHSGNTVVEIEPGYSYFVDVFTSGYDYTITMDGNSVLETFRIYTQFQLDKDEIAGIHHSKYMDINNLTGKIKLPTDKRITKFTFWATVYDEVINERMRPQGSVLGEGSGRFVYK